MFITILQDIRFLACQGLSLRDSGDMERENNFMQLLNLCGENVSEVKTWLNKKADEYTSHNECLQITILREVSYRFTTFHPFLALWQINTQA